MFKKYLKKYVILSLFLFSLVALPPIFVDSLRGRVMAVTMPFWKGMHFLKKPFITQRKLLEIKCKKLEVENQLLKGEITRHKLLFDQLGISNSLVNPAKVYQQCVIAEVVYRDPKCWSSAFWVNVGEETNKKLGSKIVSKNSPVLFGKGVVGVVEFVGKKQSRIRLITDSALKVAVRACRGSYQNLFLAEHIDSFSKALSARKDLPLSSDETAFILAKCENLKGHLLENKESSFLAKGIVQGSSSPLWRKNSHLKGMGFNYDFADPIDEMSKLANTYPEKVLPIIQLNDLLVTTGMDGVFPAHLPVGEVAKIYPLKEGAYAYNIEVTPFIQNLDDLKLVFIIPPLECDKSERESHSWR